MQKACECVVPSSFACGDCETALQPPACPVQRRNLKAATLMDNEQKSEWVKVHHGKYEKRSNQVHCVPSGNACAANAVEEAEIEEPHVEPASCKGTSGGRGKFFNASGDVPVCSHSSAPAVTVDDLFVAPAVAGEEPKIDMSFIPITWNSTGLPHDAGGGPCMVQGTMHDAHYHAALPSPHRHHCTAITSL